MLEGIIGAKDADVANNVRLKVGARHIRGGPQLGAEKPLVSEVRTKFEQFKNDRKQHQAKLLEGM